MEDQRQRVAGGDAVRGVDDLAGGVAHDGIAARQDLGDRLTISLELAADAVELVPAVIDQSPERMVKARQCVAEPLARAQQLRLEQPRAEPAAERVEALPPERHRLAQSEIEALGAVVEPLPRLIEQAARIGQP